MFRYFAGHDGNARAGPLRCCEKNLSVSRELAVAAVSAPGTPTQPGRRGGSIFAPPGNGPLFEGNSRGRRHEHMATLRDDNVPSWRAAMNGTNGAKSQVRLHRPACVHPERD